MRKHCKVGMYNVCWKGGEGSGWDSLDNPRGVDNKHMHLVTVQWQSPPGWDRHRTNLLQTGMGQTQNKLR